MEFNRHLGNILTVYAHADKLDKLHGMQAYSNYNRIMHDLAHTHRTTLHIAAGVFAALSPNADYKTNLESTERVLRAHLAGHGIDSFKVTSYGANKRKAWKIVQGTPPLDLLVARKTRSFYLNIIDPYDPAHVTIDGHMFSVWNLERSLMQHAKIGSGRKYDRIAADFKHAARAIGLIPNQMQAVCWFAWKRLNLISIDLESLQLPLLTD